jgi:hypothetical protein
VANKANLLDIKNPFNNGLGATLVNGIMTYIKKEGDTGQKTIRFWLGDHNIRPSYYFGHELSLNNSYGFLDASIIYYNSAGVSLINTYLGVINKEVQTFKLPDSFLSGVAKIAINYSVNAGGLPIGASIAFVAMRVASFEFRSPRGLTSNWATEAALQEVEVKANEVPKNKIDITNLNNSKVVIDKAVLFDINTPNSMSTDGWIIEGGKAIFTGIANTVEKAVTYRMCPIKDVNVGDYINISCTNKKRSNRLYAAIYWIGSNGVTQTSTVIGNIFADTIYEIQSIPQISSIAYMAVSVRVLAVATVDDEFILSDIKYTDYNIYNAHGKSIFLEKLQSGISIIKKLEEMPNMYDQPKIAHCGNMTIHMNYSATKITNSNTIIDTFDAIGKNNTIPKKITNLKYHNVGNHFLLHVGKSGILYMKGEYAYVYACKSFEDYISGDESKIVKVSDSLAGIIGLREMDNGELVIITANGENQYSGICVSTNWATQSATFGRATFVRKQEYSTTRNSPQDAWGFDVYGSLILYSEYAVNATSATDRVNSHVYYSDDYGSTFRSVFNVYDNSKPNTEGSTHQHIHGCSIDPYWSRLWIMLGESGVGGKAIAYSDDGGITWTQLSTSGLEKKLVGGDSVWMKYCGSHALDTGLIMGTDSQPNGIWRYNRLQKNYPDSSVAECIEEAKRFDLVVTNNPYPDYSGHERTITHIMGFVTHLLDSERGYPILVNCPLVGDINHIYQEDRTGIVYCSYDGIRFYEIWREIDPIYSHKGDFKDNNMKSYICKNGKVYIASVGSTRYEGSLTLIEGNIS